MLHMTQFWKMLYILKSKFQLKAGQGAFVPGLTCFGLF